MNRSYDQLIRIWPPSVAGGAWRATRHVPPEWATSGVGLPILGGAEGAPAFVEAGGRTPVEAVRALYAELGRCFLDFEVWRYREIQIGQRPDQITRTFEVTLEEAQAIIATFVQPNGIDVDLTAKLDPEKLPSIRALVEFAREAEVERTGRKG